MKKRIASTMVTGLFLISSSMPAFRRDAKEDIKIMIDGQQETYTDAPMIENNQVLLPLRAVVTKLGFQDDNEHIVWNAAEKSVTLHNDNTNIYFRVGSQEANVGDNLISLPAASYPKMENHMFLPIFLNKSLGKQVTWDTSSNSVSITTSKKEKATLVLKSFETGDPAAMEKWISPDTYIQHNLAFPSGRETVNRPSSN